MPGLDSHREDTDPKKKDVKRLEEKFGDSADIYAETRSEAAEIAGDQEKAEYWEEVADSLDGDDQ